MSEKGKLSEYITNEDKLTSEDCLTLFLFNEALLRKADKLEKNDGDYRWDFCPSSVLIGHFNTFCDSLKDRGIENPKEVATTYLLDDRFYILPTMEKEDKHPVNQYDEDDVPLDGRLNRLNDAASISMYKMSEDVVSDINTLQSDAVMKNVRETLDDWNSIFNNPEEHHLNHKVVLWYDTQGDKKKKDEYFQKKLILSHMFEIKIEDEFKNFGIDIGLLYGRNEQNGGESKAGIEIKYDVRGLTTENVYLEFKEKPNNSNVFVDSGFMKDDNSRVILIGTPERYALIDKNKLKDLLSEHTKKYGSEVRNYNGMWHDGVRFVTNKKQTSQALLMKKEKFYDVCDGKSIGEFIINGSCERLLGIETMNPRIAMAAVNIMKKYETVNTIELENEKVAVNSEKGKYEIECYGGEMEDSMFSFQVPVSDLYNPDKTKNCVIFSAFSKTMDKMESILITGSKMMKWFRENYENGRVKANADRVVELSCTFDELRAANLVNNDAILYSKITDLMDAQTQLRNEGRVTRKRNQMERDDG